MRIEWDKLWMRLAINLSKRSCDEKHQVGVCIIDTDNEGVLSVGYNGDHKGGSNKRLSQEHGKSGFIHAENNALIKLNYRDPAEKKMYTTLSPCYACAQLIINAGIKEVIYLELYCDKGLMLLHEQGIQVRQYNYEKAKD